MSKFSRARAAVLGVVSKAVPRCTAQASSTCAGVQKHDALLLAEFQKLRFRQIRMGFDLDHGWLDSRRFIDGQQFVQTDVRESDGPAPAMVHETFHRPPGVQQSYAVVIKDIAVLIPRILLVPGLKCKRSVN